MLLFQHNQPAGTDNIICSCFVIALWRNVCVDFSRIGPVGLVLLL